MDKRIVKSACFYYELSGTESYKDLGQFIESLDRLPVGLKSLVIECAEYHLDDDCDRISKHLSLRAGSDAEYFAMHDNMLSFFSDEEIEGIPMWKIVYLLLALVDRPALNVPGIWKQLREDIRDMNENYRNEDRIFFYVLNACVARCIK